LTTALNIGLGGAGWMGHTLAYQLAFVVGSANLVAIADAYPAEIRAFVDSLWKITLFRLLG
jgi:predicted homoserine dehydrogenase-like protein